MTGAIGPAGCYQPENHGAREATKPAPNVKDKTEKPLPDGERSNGHEGQPEQGPKPLPAARNRNRATPTTGWWGDFFAKNDICLKSAQKCSFWLFFKSVKSGKKIGAKK